MHVLCLFICTTQALRLHQEHHIARTLDLCTCIPALRHSPLKELTRLAVHLKESSYSKGPPDGQQQMLVFVGCVSVCHKGPAAAVALTRCRNLQLQSQRVQALPPKP
jgi:hypothetical protein